MALERIAPPAVLPITIAEVKPWARLDEVFQDDAHFVELISMATELLDGETGYLGRALITQDWRLVLERFAREIKIPLPPTQQVTAVKYIDPGGVEQTLDAGVYTVARDAQNSFLRLADGQTWPDTKCGVEAVKIEFTAGFGDSWNDIPQPIRSALSMTVANLFDGMAPEAAVPADMLRRWKVFEW